jgi:hypothetical protein
MMWKQLDADRNGRIWKMRECRKRERETRKQLDINNILRILLDIRVRMI